MAGFCSGNTVGLLSIDPLELEIRKQNGTNQEKAQADMILEVLHNHHLLLVTLLLYNAIAMETLPLVIHTIVPAWLAIVLSTCVVLIVGEIVPQALCTGPNKLIIAQRCVPLIRIMIKIFWVVSYPISLALDKVLG
jgi:metal transporter CNNM